MNTTPNISPNITVDGTGQINWANILLNYNPAIFYRGKQVTNAEFNDLFIKQTAHNNYIANSLKQFLTEVLPVSISRKIQTDFNITDSYTKVFGTTDWQGPDAEGYYYINIPASEHKMPVESELNSRVAIEAEMYVADEQGNFYKVDQVTVSEDNTVQIYTDDNSLIGYVIIRINSKAFAIASQELIDASLIKGIQRVALTGDYNDLINLPDISAIKTNTQKITDILEGVTAVGVSKSTKSLPREALINGVPVENVFAEEGRSEVLIAKYDDKSQVDGGCTINDKFNQIYQALGIPMGNPDNVEYIASRLVTLEDAMGDFAALDVPDNYGWATVVDALNDISTRLLSLEMGPS